MSAEEGEGKPDKVGGHGVMEGRESGFDVGEECERRRETLVSEPQSERK